MQYTGLKDKNGREIYEGDILVYRKLITEKSYYNPKAGKRIVTKRPKPKEELHFWEVFFDKGQWRMRRSESIRSLFGGELSHEVYGNIYENPDLLRV
jgi:uncharacterized phage protein (TIGR01671 family)